MTGEEETIVVAGSRTASRAMVEYTYKVVERSIQKGALIIIGDNPKGVDFAALQYLRQAGYSAYTVVSVGLETPRSIQALNGKPAVARYRYEDYHNRDMNMIWLATLTMFIWDGHSKGTLEGFEYAKLIGKKAFLADFSGKNPTTGLFPNISHHP